MRLGGRLQAAIEVLEDVLDRRTPVSLALRDWGKAHRFAGSKDRSAIGNYVLDALRHRSSLGFRMDNTSPRSLVLGTAVFLYNMDPVQLNADFDGDEHAPEKMTKTELTNLAGAIDLDGAPDWIRADVPEWIWPAFENNFGEEAVLEGQALTARPPLDLRTNTLKTTVEDAAKTLEKFGASRCILSPVGFRIPATQGDGRLPNIQIEEIFQKGGVEIQDEGSQLVSYLVDAKPGETVLDYCAGGGGKALAMAADMKNQGGVHAFDIDKRRLAPVYQRAQRAGADIIKVHQPPEKTLNFLRGKCDRVLIDAPCTGIGTWRRKPDAKWRLSEESLEVRNKEQMQVLEAAKHFVRPGGLLFYVTCSIIAEENEGQVYNFLEKNPNFTLVSGGEVWEEKFGVTGVKPWSEDGCTITLTPASTDTDGFFMAVMERSE